ncbi:adenylyltransferase/cytidyltransferase family protein [Parachlamydia sp. AcF125]|uniref:adenylyltransferase/cytidyltransferase family protein n=1 Tax=Parachlamydia sp. AcF125 TaxID=2795736 RepID=UPI001BC9DB9F|nr:adenylyltransferase/cytidyltransferase family protein [Parachlamydia sp. AcF125]
MKKTWKKACEKKICLPDQIESFISALRKTGKTIVTLNGSFDLLHAGHLQILFEASQMGDYLIVALNTDRSIQTYKNPLRPIIPLHYRIEMMAALEFVDAVTWFDETDPRNILSKIKPDVHVNGSEYGMDCIEAEVVKAHGGRIHIVDLVPGLSTSQIVQKIAAIH